MTRKVVFVLFIFSVSLIFVSCSDVETQNEQKEQIVIKPLTLSDKKYRIYGYYEKSESGEHIEQFTADEIKCYGYIITNQDTENPKIKDFNCVKLTYNKKQTSNSIEFFDVETSSANIEHIEIIMSEDSAEKYIIKIGINNNKLIAYTEMVSASAPMWNLKIEQL